MTSEFDNGIFWGQKSIQYCPDKNLEVYINATKTIGSAYSYINKNEKAISYFVKLIPIVESKKDYRQLGSLYYNIAFSYEGVFADNESEKNYKKAALYFLKAKDTSNYFALQTTFAYNHFNISRDTLQTIQFIDSVFRVYNKFKKPVEMDVCNENFTLSFKYYLLKEYQKSLYYLNKSSAFYIKTNNLDFLKYNDYLRIKINFQKNKKLIFKLIPRNHS